MYATLIGKIVKPMKAMEKGIVEITTSNDFSKTIPVHYQDEVGQVSTSFNQLTGNLKNIFDQINNVLDHVANGHFNEKCQLDIHGDLETLKNNVNASITSINVTMTSLEEVANGISEGDFSVRMNPQVKGELKTKVDNAMQNMDNIIDRINQVMQKVTESDFSERVETKATGRMDELKTFYQCGRRKHFQQHQRTQYVCRSVAPRQPLLSNQSILYGRVRKPST